MSKRHYQIFGYRLPFRAPEPVGKYDGVVAFLREQIEDRRKNPRGEHLEQWVHAHGCRRWFNVRRDTVTYRITAVYKVGESPPRA